MNMYTPKRGFYTFRSTYLKSLDKGERSNYQGKHQVCHRESVLRTKMQGLGGKCVATHQFTMSLMIFERVWEQVSVLSFDLLLFNYYASNILDIFKISLILSFNIAVVQRLVCMQFLLELTGGASKSLFVFFYLYLQQTCT